MKPVVQLYDRQEAETAPAAAGVRSDLPAVIHGPDHPYSDRAQVQVTAGEPVHHQAVADHQGHKIGINRLVV